MTTRSERRDLPPAVEIHAVSRRTGEWGRIAALRGDNDEIISSHPYEREGKLERLIDTARRAAAVWSRALPEEDVRVVLVPR